MTRCGVVGDIDGFAFDIALEGVLEALDANVEWANAMEAATNMVTRL